MAVPSLGGHVLYVYCVAIAHAFRVEWLPALVEMTSLGEGASGHCRNHSGFKSFKLGGCF